MRKLILFPLVVAFLILAILGGSHTVAAPAQATLDGTVTVNGDPAPTDVGLVAVLEDGTECGRALTGPGGTFDMSLAAECVGKTVLFRLAATEDQATTSVVIKAGTQTVDIAFEGLSTESLRAIGALPAIEVEAEQAVEKALEEAAEEGAPGLPLIAGSNLFWLVLLLSLTGMALLGLMVYVGRATAAVGDEARQAQARTYKRQVEGMILIMVIVAIILLGITEKVTDQGLVSVLAAIVGYAVARATTT